MIIPTLVSAFRRTRRPLERDHGAGMLPSSPGFMIAAASVPEIVLVGPVGVSVTVGGVV